MDTEEDITDEEIHGSTAYRKHIEHQVIESSKVIQNFSDRNAELVILLMDKDTEIERLKDQKKRIIAIAQETHIKDEEHG